MLELFLRWADEHVPHEESMVSTGADDSDIDAISLIPSCVAIYDVNAIASIEIVDSTFSVDFPCLSGVKVSQVRKHVIGGSQG